MFSWLKRLLRSIREKTDAHERLLALEREVQGLRLELKERERVVAELRRELERQRSGESARVSEVVKTQLERLMTDMAAPVAQLMTQSYLLEVEGKPVQAKDVLVVAKRLVRLLEERGLTLEGKVGETVPFDPNLHEPLSVDVSPTPGQPVVVRVPGVGHRGKILKKAGIDVVRRVE